MNFLAHLFLSGDREHLLVGNFLGDFLNNKEVSVLPESVKEGVKLHRHIDTFTDRHEVVLQSVRRLRERHGKYSPVILDVFHDFLLAKNWMRYNDTPLPEYARWAYEVLKQHLRLMPPFLQDRLPRMIADDWLVRYGTTEGLEFTFSRLKLRTSAPQWLESAVETLKTHEPELDAEFNLFFPAAIVYVNNLPFLIEK